MIKAERERWPKIIPVQLSQLQKNRNILDGQFQAILNWPQKSSFKYTFIFQPTYLNIGRGEEEPILDPALQLAVVVLVTVRFICRHQD